MTDQKNKLRDTFVPEYVTAFNKALMKQIQPVLDAIMMTSDPKLVADQIPALMQPDPIADVFYDLYPKVGTASAMLNISLINEQLKSKGMSQKSTYEDLWEQNLRQYVNQFGTERITSITGTSRQKAIESLFASIDEVLASGTGQLDAQAKITSTLEQVWGTFSAWRAERIARTEVYTAYSHADYESAQSYSVPMYKIWIHGFNSPLDRVGHVDLNGQKLDRDQQFINPNTGQPMLHPHAQGLPAGEVINCRCSLIYEPK